MSNSHSSPVDPPETAGERPETIAADIRIAAMNLLARREHSRAELHRKLRRRFDDEALLNAEIQRLEDENLQSDLRYAESTIRSRMGRGYGPRRIRQELREKAVAEDILNQAFDVLEVDWQEEANAVWRKKFGPPHDLLKAEFSLKEKARRIRFMEYRGFSAEHYQHLIED